MKVGIINVTGYIGVELARLLCRHPHVELTCVTGRSAAGQKLGDVFPHLASIDLTIQAELDSVDLAFSALPHKSSAEAVRPLVEAGVPVLDTSADFRLSAPDYKAWYGLDHPCPQYLSQAVYGLTELHRKEIAASKLIAVPGCYPTSAILALAPAMHHGLIEPDIIVDSKSGVSGAGRTLDLGTHYSEVNESVSAYSLEGHRHLPEITRELHKVRPSGPAPAVTFLPHLVPMTRGILSSCYAKLKPNALPSGKAAIAALRELYQDFYRGEPFVRVTAAPPQTKHTWGNNLCLIYPTVDVRAGRLVVVSCIDNLVKGGAGQAVQDMNLMCGFPETTGLDAPAIFP
ncbi:MAG: N-acetyl-gamma-glutamyl-phosphate reductase [Chloroflexi bacterium]|nr:N-acetyl-gamma-glutamyl-phosphate reductase [Chloroflexota bacterium]